MIRTFAAAILALPLVAQPQARPAISPRPDVRQLLTELNGISPDPCGSTPVNERDMDPSLIKMPLLNAVSEAVADALNSGSDPPAERAKKALERIKDESSQINSSWPVENRFQFDILDLNQILVIKMSVGVYERYFVFGSAAGGPGKPNDAWRRVYLIEDDSEFDVPWARVTLYRLRRGPSAQPRFLASYTMGGCAGSVGVAYDARQWNPEHGGSADQIIDLKGALGLDDKVKGFPQIGKLQTGGATIDLPYCWWSAIDTWDNPSMCAVDSYDLSGDAARFVSRRVNRPDLLPIVRATEYAEKRDFPAVRSYCTNDPVARRLVEWAPGLLFEVEVKTKILGVGRELVYDDSGNYRLIVEKRGTRWLVASFTMP
jgi:hypothetical protein